MVYLQSVAWFIISKIFSSETDSSNCNLRQSLNTVSSFLSKTAEKQKIPILNKNNNLNFSKQTILVLILKPITNLHKMVPYNLLACVKKRKHKINYCKRLPESKNAETVIGSTS